jgi:hypothetical protein
MNPWQYKSNAIPVDQGWKVNSPSHTPNDKDYTAKLVDRDGQYVYLWLHSIELGFENGGQFAQSARRRDWYARNLSGVKMTLTGRSANQSDYHNLAEFIHSTQRKSLAWQTTRQSTRGTVAHMADVGTTRLFIPSSKRHTAYDVEGHILKIDRTSERFEFAPESK